jgi:hypothetical protein
VVKIGKETVSAALDAYERYHAIVTETGYDPKAAPLDPIEQRVREIRIHLERLRMLGVREIADRCAELHAALNPTGLGRTISTVQDQQRNFGKRPVTRPARRA